MQPPFAPIAFLGPLGWPEILIIMLIVILLFGAKRLPELARGVGKSIKEFKKATSGLEDEVRSAINEEPKHAQSDHKPAQKADPSREASKSE